MMIRRINPLTFNRSESLCYQLIMVLIVLSGFSDKAVAQTQTFPVTSTVTISTPYSPHVTDYGLAGYDRFLLTIRLNDEANNGGLALKARLVINSVEEALSPAIYTSDFVSLPNSINPGQTLSFTGNQLRELFDNSTITLDEGMYSFKVLIFEDKLNGRQLSLDALGNQVIFISQNEPPFLNLPRNEVTIDYDTYNTGAGILLQWTPRHLTFNTSGVIEYRLEIYEATNFDQNPNRAFAGESMVKVCDKTFVNGETSFLLNTGSVDMNGGIQLINDKKYAWRVTASEASTNDISSQNSVFKNNGQSEVFAFYLTTPCIQPDLRDLSASAPQELSVSWLGEFNHTHYDLLYRPFDPSGGSTYQTVQTNRASATLTNLLPGTTYQVAVKAYCGTTPSPVKELGNVTTVEEVVEECVAPSHIMLKNESDPAKQIFTWTDVSGAASYELTVNNVLAYTSITNDFTLEGASVLGEGEVTVTVKAICKEVDGVVAEQISDPFTFNITNTNEEVFAGECKAPSPVLLEAMPVEIAIDAAPGDLLKANVSWSKGEEHTSYVFRYYEGRKVDNSISWEPEQTVTSNSLTLSDLSRNVYYTYAIKYQCDGAEAANFTEKQEFFIESEALKEELIEEGTGNCFKPAFIAHQVNTETDVDIIWDRVKGSMEYEFLYREKGSSSWEIITQFERRLVLENLVSETEYEYQVRSECKVGFSQYTDLKTFDTGDVIPEVEDCPKVTNLEILDAGETFITVGWGLNDVYTGFILEYKGASQSTWYTHQVNQFDLPFVLNDLKEGEEYDVRVTAQCGSLESKPSSLGNFNTVTEAPPITDFSCGTGGSSCDPIIGGTPLILTKEEGNNNVFTLGEFDITIEEITDGNGTGFITVPYMDFARLRVTFNNVVVSENGCASAGEASVIGAVIYVLSPELSAQIQEGLDKVSSVLDQAQSYVDLASSTLANIDAIIASIDEPVDITPYLNLSPQEMYEKGKELLAQGQQVYDDIKSDPNAGNITTAIQTIKLGAALIKESIAAAGDVVREVTDLDSKIDHVIHFIDAISTEDLKGFDAYSSSREMGTFSDFYQRIKDADNKEYHVPYISIDEGETAQVKVEIDITAYDASKLKFSTQSLTKIRSGISAGVSGLPTDIIDESLYVTISAGDKRVYAVYDNNETTEVLGKLKVIEAKPIEKTLVIVPLAGSSQTFSDAIIQPYLMTTFKGGNVNWTVEVSSDEIQSGTPGLNSENQIVIDGRGGIFSSRFSDEMLELQADYFAEHGEDKNKVYLFEVAGFVDSDGVVAGIDDYMPRGKNVGFISTGAGKKEIAHELAHGVFGLEHPWELTSEEQNTTDNLMDYGLNDQTDNVLMGAQWDQIQNPNFDIYALDQTEGGALVRVTDLSVLEKFVTDDGWITFLSPAGVPISFEFNLLTEVYFATAADEYSSKINPGTEISYPIGTLRSFTWGGIRYIPFIRSSPMNGKDYFSGYKISESDISSYEEDFSSKSEYKFILGGIPCINNGQVDFRIFPLTYKPDDEHKAELENKGTGPYLMDLALQPYFDKENQAVSVAAVFLNGEDVNGVEFLMKYVDLNSCGAEAFYAFKIADYLESHPEVKVCLDNFDAESEFLTPTITEKSFFGEALVDNVYTNSIYASIISKEKETVRNNGEVYLKNFYEIMKEYSEVISVGPNNINFKDVPTFIKYSKYYNRQPAHIRKCLLETLTYSERFELIPSILNFAGSIFLDGDMINHIKAEFINEILLNTPASDYDKLLNSLKSEDYKLFWSLNNFMRDASLAHHDLFTSFLTEVIYARSSSNEIDNTQTLHTTCDGTQRAIGTFIVYSSGLERDAKLVDRINTNEVDGHQIKVQSKRRQLINGELIDIFCMQLKEDPFQLLRVQFTDDYLITGPGGQKMVPDKDHVVPALWLHWFLEAEDSKRNSIAINIVASTGALIITVATGGTTAPLWFAAEVALEASSLGLALAETSILESGDQDAIDAFKSIQDVADVLGVITLSADINKIVKIEHNFRAISEKIANTESLGELLNISAKLKVAYRRISKLTTNINNIPALQAMYQRIYFEVEIRSQLKSIKINSQITVNQGNKLLFETVSNEGKVIRVSELGKVNGSIENATLYLDDIKPYSNLQHGDRAFHEIVGRLENVSFGSASGTPKTYDIVKGTNGYFLQEIINVSDLNLKVGLEFPEIRKLISQGNGNNVLLGEIDNLPSTSYSVLETSLGTSSDLVTVFKNSPDAIKSWKKLQGVSSELVKNSPLHLGRFNRLSSEVQDQVIKFSDNAESPTMKLFLNDCDNDMIKLLNKEPQHMEVIVGHKNGFTVSDYDNYDDIIDEDIIALAQTKTKLTHWINRSAKLSNFGESVKLGNSLSGKIVDEMGSALKGKKSSALFSQLSDLSDISKNDLIKDYKMFTEVPLITENGFMKADIMLVKRNAEGGIEDVIVIENKLSSNTAFTKRQKEGWKKIAKGEQMQLKYNVQGLETSVGSFLISRKKVFKFSDHGTDNLSQTTIEQIDVDLFNK